MQDLNMYSLLLKLAEMEATTPIRVWFGLSYVESWHSIFTELIYSIAHSNSARQMWRDKFSFFSELQLIITITSATNF